MSDQPRVVIAHEEAAIRDAAVHVARKSGYEVVGVADGESARILMRSLPTPAAMVVDVALSGVLGYELAAEASELGLDTKIIFIASVYSKTAYKRRPTSLYGAYDYVEQHHIVDQLQGKLEAALRSRRQSVRRRQVTDTGQLKAIEIQRAGEARLGFRYTGLEEGITRAQRLARLIVADVLLYCGDVVEAWLESDHPGNIPESLAADLEEGRRVFALRVPPEITKNRDFIGDALGELIEVRKKKEPATR